MAQVVGGELQFYAVGTEPLGAPHDARIVDEDIHALLTCKKNKKNKKNKKQ